MFQIVESTELTITESEIVPRTWRERLFSWPWRPWVKTKLIVRTMPDPNTYLMLSLYGEQVAICHPAIATALRERMGSVWEQNRMGEWIDPSIHCPRVDRPGA